MATFLFSNPQAPYRNPPPVPEFYKPSVYYITALTLGQTTIVTTATEHNYIVGNEARLHIPSFYGTSQLNEQQGLVISIPSPTQVELQINSSQFNAFITSPPYGPTKPQICAIGDYNSGAINSSGRIANGTTIPGAFQNTSPIEGTWLD